MLGVNRPEHLLLAEELIVVLFGLGIETRIVIGAEGRAAVAVEFIASFRRRRRRVPGSQAQVSSP